MPRIQHRREPSRSELRTLRAGRQVKHPVNLVVEAIQREAQEAGFRPPLFDVYSGYRSVARQQVLWDRALERYGSEAEARRWVAPPGRSAHHTGGAIDFNLGYPIKRVHVSDIEATPQWRWLRDYAAPKYKLAPYSREPWHWECDAACEENIFRIRDEEARASLPRDEPAPAPPPIPITPAPEPEVEEEEGHQFVAVGSPHTKSTSTGKKVFIVAAGAGAAVAIYFAFKK